MDYELSKKYFKSNSDCLLNILTAMSLCIVGAVIWVGADVILGIIPIGIGFFLIIREILRAMQHIVTDEEYDANTKKGIMGIREKAMAALGIDESDVEEIAPISFEGYSYDDAVNFKRGDDGRYRSNKYRMVYIMFSANEAHVYKYTFDTMQNKTSEETDVYFYKDIVSVSTSFEMIKINNKKIETEFFKLTTTGGNSLSVSIMDKEGTQRSINAMRALLKEKKQM